ncbi:MAG: hypothetical protein H0W61_12595 [Bacteroidetes bacterium]|nr:hypothetical protein [Bacteroidota bacterium]
MKTIHHKINIRLEIVYTFCFFLFVCFTSVAAGEDSLKNNFDINDPRNPHCPCHKHQELADKEYKELLDLNKKKLNLNDIHVSENNTDIAVNSSIKENNITKTKNGSGRKYKSKKKTNRHPKWRKILDGIHWNSLNRRLSTDACTHW